jgi:hypothetical protein
MKKSQRRFARRDSGRKPEPHFTPHVDAGETEAKAADSDRASASDPEEDRKRAAAFLKGAVWAAVGIPALFYLRFGVIDSFALSFTCFVVVLCLLSALSYSVRDRPELQTPVAPKSGLLDRVGGFWLVACAFGPLFGWLATAPVVALTEKNWWWRYAARVVLCVGLPVLTALPLFFYVRGKGWPLMLLLLTGVTALPVWSGMNSLRDLREGPVVKRTTGFYDASSGSFSPSATGRPFDLTILPHTERAIKIEPAKPAAGD